MTLQNDYRVDLVRAGWTVTKELKNCLMLTHPNYRFQFYLGTRGSLRRGTTRGSSLPVGPIWFRDFLAGAFDAYRACS